MRPAIFALAAINTVAAATFMVTMFVTDGWLEAHEGKAAGSSLMLLILWALANALATWRLVGLERD